MKHVWRLSVAYIRLKSRTERPRKTKIGTEVVHVTKTPLSMSKGQLAGGGGILWRPPTQLVAHVSDLDRETWRRISVYIIDYCWSAFNHLSVYCMRLYFSAKVENFAVIFLDHLLLLWTCMPSVICNWKCSVHQHKTYRVSQKKITAKVFHQYFCRLLKPFFQDI